MNPAPPKPPAIPFDLQDMLDELREDLREDDDDEEEDLLEDLEEDLEDEPEDEDELDDRPLAEIMAEVCQTLIEAGKTLELDYDYSRLDEIVARLARITGKDEPR